MKKMMITGVNGFIGRNAMEYFQDKYEVAGIDLSDCGSLKHYYSCNMSKESDKLLRIITDEEPDVILHCAGSADVGASVADPMSDLDSNLYSLYRLLLALRTLKKQPEMIFFSSAAVYGNPTRLPMKETDAPSPVSPYGLHKLMCEELCRYYNKLYGYHIRCVRIFSAYGNGLRKQILWDMYQKYKRFGHIALFGTGSETRDFIHAADIMRAIELVIHYKGSEEIFNVANGEEISIRELAAAYANALGEDCGIISFNGEAKAGDPQNWRADISLIKGLGYRKSIGMRAGIEDYVKWVKM